MSLPPDRDFFVVSVKDVGPVEAGYVFSRTLSFATISKLNKSKSEMTGSKLVSRNMAILAMSQTL